jgi:hypothetical protein
MTDKVHDHNLNDRVRVTLTDAGKKVWVAYHVGLRVETPALRRDRTIEMPLWELMQIFGPHLRIGFHDLPFVDNRLTFLSSGPT